MKKLKEIPVPVKLAFGLAITLPMSYIGSLQFEPINPLYFKFMWLPQIFLDLCYGMVQTLITLTALGTIGLLIYLFYFILHEIYQWFVPKN